MRVRKVSKKVKPLVIDQRISIINLLKEGQTPQEIASRLKVSLLDVLSIEEIVNY